MSEEIAVVDEHPEIITVQDLVDKCWAQAQKFGERSETRLLLFNCSRALSELATRLDTAEKQLAERAKSTLVITDN